MCSAQRFPRCSMMNPQYLHVYFFRFDLFSTFSLSVKCSLTKSLSVRPPMDREVEQAELPLRMSLYRRHDSDCLRFVQDIVRQFWCTKIKPTIQSGPSLLSGQLTNRHHSPPE